MSNMDSVRAWLRADWRQVLAVVVPLCVLFGPGLVAHGVQSSDPMRFNDDVRQQIYPFFKYYEAGLFPADYPAAYYRACMPLGYQALYTFGGFFFDPASIAKALPYLLLGVVAVAMGVASKRLAGYPGAFVTMSLVFASGVFLERMVGGLPRGFGYPLAALAAMGLTLGRAWFLATLVCVGAAFYPAGAMPAGIALTLMLFVLPAADRGDAATWPLRKRALVIVGVGLLSALILLPTLIASRSYGRTLRPAEQGSFPELGPTGRYSYAPDRSPFMSFPDEALGQAKEMLRPSGRSLVEPVHEWTKTRTPVYRDSHGQTLLEILAAFLMVGGVVMAARDSAGRRLLMLALAAWLGHLLARPVAPYLYLPQRYACYPVPVVLAVMIPACAAALGNALFCSRADLRASNVKARGPWLRSWLPVAIAGLFVLVPFGGLGNASTGMPIHVTSHKSLYDFLRTLPKDSLIAGWPTDMDNVPYLSRRQVLVHYEVHQAFHERYVVEMRQRMRALIDAYFATDVGPLVRLRDAWKVTHFVFRPDYLRRRPNYFSPFGEWTEAAFKRGKAHGFELPRQVEAARVFSDETDIVLDLKRLKIEPAVR